MAKFKGYQLHLMFVEDSTREYGYPYRVNNLMQAPIVCMNCKHETTRDQCKSGHISGDDLIAEDKPDGRTGTSYYCPECESFLRYDNDLTLELEGDGDE